MRGATLIRAGALPCTPWKNGGGATREIAVFPPGSGLDDFVWRVSLADVASAGPFSRFDGIERSLLLLAGAGMRLDEEGGTSHRLEHAFDRLDFAGETAIVAHPLAGATRDFNLMLRRGAAEGTIDIVRAPQEARLGDEQVLLFCATGEAAIRLDDEAALTLTAEDTLYVDPARGRRCRIDGDGVVLRVGIRLSAPGEETR
jgi:hypothetical protein